MEEQIINDNQKVPTPITPKSSSNSLTTLLSIGLILASIVAGFFAWQTQKLVKQLNEQENDQNTPTPTLLPSIEDETKDWIIYKDQLYTFKHPSSWDTYLIGEETSKTLMVAPKEKIDVVKEMKGGFGGGTFLILTINKVSTPPTWITDENWQVSSKKIEVGGIESIQYEISVLQDLPGIGKGDHITSTVANQGSSYIQIDLLDQEYRETFDDILSTFKFIEDTKSPQPTPLI